MQKNEHTEIKVTRQKRNTNTVCPPAVHSHPWILAFPFPLSLSANGYFLVCLHFVSFHITITFWRGQEDPLNPEFYSVRLQGIWVGSNRLNVPAQVFQRGYGGVVDSGTTFLYLPAEAHAQFNQILEAEVARHSDKVRRVPSPDPRYPEDLCYASTPYLANALLFRQHGRAPGAAAQEAEAAAEALLEAFPNVTMEMAAAGDPARSVEVGFSPANYLFRLPGASVSAPGFCVGVYNNGDAGVLLGSVLMRNHLVHFDLGNKRIGFADYDCDSL